MTTLLDDAGAVARRVAKPRRVTAQPGALPIDEKAQGVVRWFVDYTPPPWTEHGGNAQGVRVRFECSSRSDNIDLMNELATDLVAEANKPWNGSGFKPFQARMASTSSKFGPERVGLDVVVEGVV